MATKKIHAIKRWVVLTVAVVLLGAAGYGGYLYYISIQKRPQYSAEQKHEADETLSKYNLGGDKDIAQQYTILVHDQHYDAANKLFSDRIKSAANDEERSSLYKQQILLALANKLPDQALTAANAFMVFQPSYDSYAEVARVYAVKFDQAKQREFYQKALDDIKAKDVKNKDQLVAYYQAKLSMLKEVK